MVVFHRRLPKFEYLAPETLDEVLHYLSSYHGQAAVMAGGTDLVPKIKSRKIKTPDYVIDLKNVPGLDYIKYDDQSGLTIGTLTTVREIEKSPLIKEKYFLLWEAAASLASVQVRNRATLAGNICNAIPSADTAPALLDLEAQLKLVSRKGTRTVKISNFFTGPNQTMVSADEIMTEIQLPVLPAGTRGKYLKLSPRRAMDLALVGVAVLAVIGSRSFEDVRIALGAVAPTPIRAKQAETMLRGQKISPEIIALAAKMAAKEAQPIDDHRASAEYRRDMVRVLTGRALEQTCSGSNSSHHETN
jgi:aerobic carbon-monoxide dehydrogenase medium subunit